MRTSEAGFALGANERHALLVLAVLAAFVPARSNAQQVATEQPSIVVAFVTDTAGKPLEGAQVDVVGTSVSGNTDTRGRVALLAVPPGNAVLRLRHLGFGELKIPISLTPGTVADGHYKMKPLPVTDLKGVVIRASELKPERYAKTGRFDDFYRRKASGMGTFLTREDIDARHAQKPEDLIRVVSGVRTRYRGMTPYLQFLRCDYVNVYVDGFRSGDGFRDFFALSPLDIEAIEVYHGMATIPPEFALHSEDCAAIVVWTRWHGAQK
ncbi:MAG: carboxypeptidase regulatory-like domain-containing protein [Gemmatimonadaceae bacterium]